MSDRESWSARMVTRDGDPLEPSDCAQWRSETGGSSRPTWLSETVDLDYVIISGNHHRSTNVYHLPSDDDPERPKCRFGEEAGHRWRVRDPELLWDTHTLCTYCSGEFGGGRDGDGGETE